MQGKSIMMDKDKDDDDSHTKYMEMGSSNIGVVFGEVGRYLAAIQATVIIKINTIIFT